MVKGMFCTCYYVLLYCLSDIGYNIREGNLVVLTSVVDPREVKENSVELENRGLSQVAGHCALSSGSRSKSILHSSQVQVRSCL